MSVQCYFKFFVCFLFQRVFKHFKVFNFSIFFLGRFAETDVHSMFLEPCHKMCLNSVRTSLCTSSTVTQQGKTTPAREQQIHTLRPTRRVPNVTKVMLKTSRSTVRRVQSYNPWFSEKFQNNRKLFKMLQICEGFSSSKICGMLKVWKVFELFWKLLQVFVIFESFEHLGSNLNIFWKIFLISILNFYSSSFSFLHSLCLGDSDSVCIHPCLIQSSVWFCRSSMRCQRCTTQTTSSVSVSFNVRRQDVEYSGFNLSHSFNHNSWQWGPAPSLSDATYFVYFDQGAAICHGVPHKPSQFVASHASFSGCLIQLVPRTTPFLVIHKPALVRSWWPTKIPWVMRLANAPTPSSPVLRNQTFSPNCAIGFLHLCPVRPSSLVFSIFTDSSFFLYALSCKTVKPAE